MAGGKVQHWKHGWIPISPEAKAYVRGEGPRPGTSRLRTSADDARDRIQARDLLSRMHKTFDPDVVGDAAFEHNGAGVNSNDLEFTPAQKTEVSRYAGEFFDDFPALRWKQHFKIQDSRLRQPGDMADTEMDTKDHKITISTDLLDDKYLQGILDSGQAEGMTISTTSAHTVQDMRALAIKHEMSHMLAARLREEMGGDNGGMLSSNGPVGPLDQLSATEVTPRQMGFTTSADGDDSALDQPVPRFMADSLDHKSSYAMSGSPDEWIAEAITDGMFNGDNASEGGKRAYAVAKIFGATNVADAKKIAKDAGL